MAVRDRDLDLKGSFKMLIDELVVYALAVEKCEPHKRSYDAHSLASYLIRDENWINSLLGKTYCDEIADKLSKGHWHDRLPF